LELCPFPGIIWPEYRFFRVDLISGRGEQEGAMKRIAVVVVAGMSLSGCWNFPTSNPVVNGAIIGGTAGAVIGGVASGNVAGAALGGGIGAATGALIGASVQ
jgi:osmotically inducible lipoprotein OsmB